jgi:hypothetical protein
VSIHCFRKHLHHQGLRWWLLQLHVAFIPKSMLSAVPMHTAWGHNGWNQLANGVLSQHEPLGEQYVESGSLSSQPKSLVTDPSLWCFLMTSLLIMFITGYHAQLTRESHISVEVGKVHLISMASFTKCSLFSLVPYCPWSLSQLIWMVCAAHIHYISSQSCGLSNIHLASFTWAMLQTLRPLSSFTKRWAFFLVGTCTCWSYHTWPAYSVEWPSWSVYPTVQVTSA